MSVFVLDKNKKPLMPCSEKRARLLLTRKRARIHKMYPFTIRLVDRKVEDSTLQDVEICIDPGSKTTGISIIRKQTINNQNKEENNRFVLHLSEIQHRGLQIKEALEARRNMRKRRRNKNLRHRKCRFLNRTRKEGWLLPSLQSRVDNINSWVNRYRNIAPINKINVESVRFDMQKMQNPEISGIEYQQGELQGYETREYLLEKWGRKCSYCDKTEVKLQIEHIVAKSKGGSNRVSNLCLACEECNQKKGNLPIEDFLKNSPERLKKITSQCKVPLRDAAAVNAARNALVRNLRKNNISVETSSGGMTKWNRNRLNVPKSHCLDAACVGEFDNLSGWDMPVLLIRAMGRGSRQRCRLDRYGFPRAYLSKEKSFYGFRTGDIVCADVKKGTKKGIYVGRIAVRSSGSFNIQENGSVIQGISYKYMVKLQLGDGYGYGRREKESRLQSLHRHE